MLIETYEFDSYLLVSIDNIFKSIFTLKKSGNLSIFLKNYSISETKKNKKKLCKDLLNNGYKIDEGIVFNPELEHLNRFYFINNSNENNNKNIDNKSIKIKKIIFNDDFINRYFNGKKKLNKISDINILNGFYKNSYFFESTVSKSNLFKNKLKGDAIGVQKNTIYPMITYADCTPIALFVNNKEEIHFSIHSGWKSTCLNITGNIIDWVKLKFNVENKDIFIVLGPAIAGNYYEVKDDIFLSKEFVYLIKVMTFLYNLKENENNLEIENNFFDFKKFKKLIKEYSYFKSANKELLSLYNKIKYSQIYEKNELLIFLYIVSRFFNFKKSKIYFDYKKLLLWQLDLKNINNIFNLNIDTYSDERFSSYRKDKKNYIAQGLITIIQ